MNVIAIRQPTGEVNLPPESGDELGTFSLKWIFAFLVRRRMLIAATAVVVFVLALTAFLMQRPQYSATALLMINAGQESVRSQNQMITNNTQVVPTQVVDSQLEVLRSSFLAERLTDSLGLVNDPEWNVFLKPGQPQLSAAATEQARQEVVELV